MEPHRKCHIFCTTKTGSDIILPVTILREIVAEAANEEEGGDEGEQHKLR